MITIDTDFLYKNGFVKNDKDILTKRIHAMIYLEYDLADGFITLVRIKENVKNNIVKIIIPKKIKTQDDLIYLLNAII